MVKICCITYRNLNDLVKEARELITDEDLEISLVEGLYEEIIEKVEREIAAGATVLVAGGGNAKIVERKFNLPVLYYKITEFDYLTAIYKASQNGKRVAVATLQTGLSEKLLAHIREQNMDVVNLVYETTEELESELKRSGAEVVIGTAHPLELAMRLGKEGLSIYPGTASIVDTIYDAKQMAEEITKVRTRNQYVNTVMQYTTNGVLLIDAAEQIIDYNEVLRDMLDLKGRNWRGQDVKGLIGDWNEDGFKTGQLKEKHEIRSIGDQELLMKVVKIGNDQRSFEGAVIIMLKLNEIRKAQLQHEEKQRLSQQKKGFHAKNRFSDIIGSSYQVKSCIADAKVFAKSNASILITGQTGVGKEIFSQSIHNESSRAKGPFIAVNCGALTESLLETELFGYEEGAFTGSRRGGKKGLFELAEGGTIFLDEIGEISPTMQTKLLRVLQEHEIMRVGGECIIPIDARVISATNRDLETDDSGFRSDLLYRLNVLELKLPALCERGEDTVLLFEHFFRRRSSLHLMDRTLPAEVKNIVYYYTWHGNIREIQNVCERYCLFLEQIPKLDARVMKRCIIKAIGEDKLFNTILDKCHYQESGITAELIEAMQQILSYNKDKIAEVLGKSRTTIWRAAKKRD